WTQPYQSLCAKDLDIQRQRQARIAAHVAIAPKAKKPRKTPIPRENTKNPEDEKRWREVREEVSGIVRSTKDAGALPSVEMDKDMLRGITMRPSGKFQAQMYFSGQSRYIGVFTTKEQAAWAYEMIRKRIKPTQSSTTPNAKASATGLAIVASKPTGSIILPASARAITPSPTMGGDKRGLGAAAMTPPHLHVLATSMASPQALTSANSSALTPSMHRASSGGNYAPPSALQQQQPKPPS
ncbi:MAG: hypothetical protein SGARI_006320, partial [Bacillariaceae sp.]